MVCKGEKRNATRIELAVRTFESKSRAETASHASCNLLDGTESPFKSLMPNPCLTSIQYL